MSNLINYVISIILFSLLIIVNISQSNAVLNQQVQEQEQLRHQQLQKIQNSQHQSIKICCKLSEVVSRHFTCLNTTNYNNNLTNESDDHNNNHDDSNNMVIEKFLKSISSWWSTHLFIFIGFPICTNNDYELFKESQARKFSMDNGSLTIILKEDGPERFVNNYYNAEEFCIHQMKQSRAMLVELELGLNHNNTDVNDNDADEYIIVAVVCQKKEWRIIFYTILTITSTLFIILTLIYHLKCNWTQYQLLHSWLQCLYLMMLILAFVCLSIFGILKIIKFDSMFDQSRLLVCQILGNILHFSFLSSFLWFTMINLDLWLCLACHKQNSSSITKSTTISKLSLWFNKKNLIFILASFGLPIIFTWKKEAFDFMPIASKLGLLPTTTTITESTLNETNSSHVIEDDVDDAKEIGHCKLTTKFPYLYAPIEILLLVNSLFLLMTILSFRKRTIQPSSPLGSSVTEELAINARQNNDRNKQSKMLALFTKLFICMSILWSLEFTSWAMSTFLSTHYKSQSWTHALYLVLDSINFSQGILIFVMYLWQENNLCHKIRGGFKIGLRKRITGQGEEEGSSRHGHGRQRQAAGAGTSTISSSSMLSVVQESQSSIIEEPLTELHF